MWLQLGQNWFLHAQFITYFWGFYFCAHAVAQQRDSGLIALRKRFGIRALKNFLMILNCCFFFLSRLKAVEIKDEWRCWGEQKATVMFPFCIQKCQIFRLLQKWGRKIIMSLYSPRTNGNLTCDSSHIENNQSVNKALLNEILVLCSTLAFI